MTTKKEKSKGKELSTFIKVLWLRLIWRYLYFTWVLLSSATLYFYFYFLLHYIYLRARITFFRLRFDIKKTVLMARGFDPDGPRPPTRGECLKQFVSGVGGVGLRRAGETVQQSERYAALCPYPRQWHQHTRCWWRRWGWTQWWQGVEVHHHCLWQVELLQLPQETHPPLCFLGGAGFFL